MKKIKKAVKKSPKKIVIIAVAIALILNYIIPLSKVFADTYTYTLTFTINSGNQNQHTMVNENGNLKIDGQYVELRDGDNQRIGTVACVDGPVCTITVTDGPKATLNYNGNNSYSLYMQGHDVGHDFEFQANEAIAVQDYVAPQQNDNPAGPEPGEGFDGRAVVLWSCGNGVCYHQFDVVDREHCDPEHPTDACNPEISNFNDGNSTFFRDTYVTADNKDNTHFDVNAEYREWYLQDEFDKWKNLYKIANNMDQNAEIDWDTMDPELIMGAPNQNIEQLEQDAAGTCGAKPDEEADDQVKEEFEDCIHLYAANNGDIWTHELQPVNEPDANNAYVSYGDRNFKVVIYNDEYRGVTTTADFSGLQYYPADWADPYTRTDQYDVSSTSESNPTGLNSILLENTVNLDILPYNDYEIDTIEALDVPADAVSINPVEKQNPEDNQKFRIVFSSNFYDHVIFKLTDTNGGESYIQIKRFTIDGWIRDNSVLTADFYFNKDESYEDFILTAKILYYDGTTENVTLEAVNEFRDSLGNPIHGYEANQEEAEGPFKGKGLKQSVFEYNIGEDAERRVKDVYLNAEYKGSNPSVYAGAYSGSGEGTPANLYHPDQEGGE